MSLLNHISFNSSEAGVGQRAGDEENGTST